MWKILVTATHFDTLCTNAKRLLEENGCELIVNQTENAYYSFEQLKEVAGEIDGAIIAMDEWNEEVFRIAPRLKVLARFGVGINNVDLVKAKEYGIKVVNAKGQNANAVAEFCMGMILNSLRHVGQIQGELSRGRWVRTVGTELKGKTVGLLGFGDIAGRVAKKLSGFEVNLLAYDLFPNEEKARSLGVKMTSLEDVLRNSDIVSVHVPDIPETYHLLNRETIGMMKDGAYVINTARGRLIDTEALCDAVKSGKLSGASLDVYEQEPLPMDAGVLNVPGIFCTPHAGAETYEVYEQISMFTAKAVLDVLNGKEPENWLNR